MPAARGRGAWRWGALALVLATIFGVLGCSGGRPVAPESQRTRAPLKPLNPLPDARTELVLVADEWMPYTGRPGGREGFATELARAALARAGRSVRYETKPWKRCLADARAGLVDGVLCVDPSEASDLVFSSEAIAPTKPALYVLKGFTVGGRRWRYRGNEESLKGLRISVVEGYRYDAPIRRYVERHRGTALVHEVRGEDPVERQIRALLVGRVDVFAQNELVVDWVLRGRPEASRIELAGRTPGGGLFVAFSPKRRDARELAAEFDRELRALRASGEASAIAKRYGVRP